MYNNSLTKGLILVEYKALGVGVLIKRITSIKAFCNLGNISVNREANFIYSYSNSLIYKGINIIVSGSN